MKPAAYHHGLRIEPHDDPKPTLADWMERWEDERAQGLTYITREEAERRYYQTYGRDDQHSLGEG